MARRITLPFSTSSGDCAMPNQPPILEMKNITKTFPGVKALNNVSFRVVKVEINCLVGENSFLF
jgi:ABC-type sugar transport system ATPase subunit